MPRFLSILCLLLCLAACGEKETKPPDNAQETPSHPVVTTAAGEEMILLPGGAFAMGSDSPSENGMPRHRVRVDSFLIDRHEVTQAHYERVEYVNAAHFKDPKRPMEMVRWYEAMIFCNNRSRAESLEPCFNEETMECDFEKNGYRLPTEAEWEYACRAGSDDAYSFGNAEGQLGLYAWHDANSKKRTQLVGEKKPNAWGLYDMHGNVAEWCLDYYVKNPAAPAGEQKNPRGPATGKLRVVRGGSWKSKPASACASATRVGMESGMGDACFADDTVGFRCVRRLSAEERKKSAETSPPKTE